MDFKLLSKERFYVQGLSDLDFCPSYPKFNTDHLWWMSHHAIMVVLINQNRFLVIERQGIAVICWPVTMAIFTFKYSSNLLTPTWPLCKNILSVDYERSISFRKCNRWKSFEIVLVCLNNKNVIIFNIITMYDSDGLVEGWASIACDPKVAVSSLNRSLFQLLYW